MSNKTIIAIGAHADDIESNAGGSLLKYHFQGYKIVYVMATNNMSGIDERRRNKDDNDNIYPGTAYPMPPQECYITRRNEALEAAKHFGTIPIFLNYPQESYHENGVFKSVRLKYGSPMPEGFPNDLPCIVNACNFEECISNLAEIISIEDPEFIFTHSIDYNQEHNGTALLVVNAFDCAHKKGVRGTLLSWVSSQRYYFKTAPDVIIDISDYMDKKMEILFLHVSQANKNWIERYRTVAKFWGTWSGNCSAEGKYAEAFKTVRIGKLF